MDKDFKDSVKIFKALCDENRLHILDILHGFNAYIEMLPDEILRDDFV